MILLGTIPRARSGWGLCCSSEAVGGGGLETLHYCWACDIEGSPRVWVSGGKGNGFDGMPPDAAAMVAVITGCCCVV